MKQSEEANQKLVLFEEIVSSMYETYRKKNADYGNSFTKLRYEFPDSILIRLSDKLNRLKSLRGSGKQMVADESQIDTLIDMANYAIMEVIEMLLDKQALEQLQANQVDETNLVHFKK